MNKKLAKGLNQVHAPLSGHNLLKDLKLKIDLQEEILKGIRKKAKESSLTDDDINTAIKAWGNTRINLNRALALLVRMYFKYH